MKTILYVAACVQALLVASHVVHCFMTPDIRTDLAWIAVNGLTLVWMVLCLRAWRPFMSDEKGNE